MVFHGLSFGAQRESAGETIFHTGMTGYQEIITDPSYKGQLVVMTTPHIGNTGINFFDSESDRVHVEALIVKEYCDTPSNWRSKKSLAAFLKEFNVPAMEGVDTRYLTRVLRQEGSLRAVLSTQDLNPDSLVQKAKNTPPLEGQNLAKTVSTPHPYLFKESSHPSKFHVVVFDLGIKQSILKRFSKNQCRVTVVPCSATSNDVLNLKPDGIFLSNGPGDPAAVKNMIETAQKLIGKKPMFGICLGHQILALALGGTTSKLKFGHHGGNHPVQHLSSKKIEITSQNHCFVVDPDSLPKTAELTHVNLNDHTVEGFRDTDRQLMSVQYHPESAPGPQDSTYLFNEFVAMMEKNL